MCTGVSEASDINQDGLVSSVHPLDFSSVRPLLQTSSQVHDAMSRVASSEFVVLTTEYNPARGYDRLTRQFKHYIGSRDSHSSISRLRLKETIFRRIWLVSSIMPSVRDEYRPILTVAYLV